MSVGIKTKDPQQPLCSLTSVYSPLCPVPALSGAASGAPASPSRRPLPHPVQPPDWELHEEGFGSCAQGTRSVEPDPRQPLSKHGGNPAAEHPTLRRDGDLGPCVEGAAASRVASPAPGRWHLLTLGTSRGSATRSCQVGVPPFKRKSSCKGIRLRPSGLLASGAYRNAPPRARPRPARRGTRPACRPRLRPGDNAASVPFPTPTNVWHRGRAQLKFNHVLPADGRQSHGRLGLVRGLKLEQETNAPCTRGASGASWRRHAASPMS